MKMHLNAVEIKQEINALFYELEHFRAGSGNKALTDTAILLKKAVQKMDDYLAGKQ